MAKRKNSFITRFFTKENVHPYDEVNWVKRNAEIPGSGFKMENVEFPDFYSQNAVNIIASKYFKVNRGKQETSLKELIDRIVKTFKKWGLEQGYFDEKEAEIYEKELTYIILHQYATFNSPVWFNVGVEGRSQQCSACFILDVEDNMESILDWIKIEGLIFKGGSGSGVNLSKLRAKGEKLSTGGASSGVISFMRAADAVAGSIKCLPRGTEIITKKGVKKIEDLEENDEVLTRFGFQKIGRKYYTGKKKIYKITTELGIEILASAEHKFLVRREGGIEEWKELRELDLDKDYLILDLSLKEYGTYQKLEKIELQHHNEKPIKMPEILDEKFAEWLGLLYGDGNITNIEYANKNSTHYIGFQVDVQDKDLIKYIQDLSYELFGVKSFIHRRKDKKDNSVSVRITSHPLIRFLKVNGLYKTKGDKIRVPEKIKNSPPAVRAAFLRGYFESDGSITKNKPYPACSSINKEFIEDIQNLLFSLGILNKKRISKSRKNSYGKKPVYNLIVTSSFGIKRFFDLVNFISERKKRKFERAIKILDKRPFEQRWILPYPENDFEIVYQNIPNETRYFFRRLTSKYFRETVGKTNFNRFRANYLLSKFPFLENTFIGYFAKNDVYYEKIKEIKFVGEEEAYDIFVPNVNEYLVKNIVVHNSGGATRRAAKMVILNADHPEIMDFIRVKAEEENKVRALMEAGYDMTDMNNPLWQNIFFQNANNSVRIPDALMEAAMKDGEWKTYYRTTGEVARVYKAKDILWEIAKAAWECGDPGVQFDDIIQKWHTCKNSGRIEATNPCSEFVFLNWNSCNLASINLLKFLKEDGSFDVPAFIHTARVMFLSQDLLISKADYPHPKIAEETKKYRTIGLGYTNLGALIMALGLPYDSDEARDLAASITALMTGTAYKLSAEIASKLGPFPEYEKNKEPMMEVMKMHKDHLKYVKENEFNKEILEKAKEVWNEVIELGGKYGFRNAQSTVIAPTGTISFMMDADTTGIEPDFALVKMKQLVGGGYMKIVNKTVPLALKRLGYTEEQIKDIVKHLEETQNIETAPHLKEEHLPVFDCAIKPPGGKRYIHWMGHVKMVAAVQPFVSGGISKTFNMPNETTIQEIYDAYFTAWKLGIKCFAVYRDGSKATQALYVSKQEKKQKETFTRKKLPDIRPSETHKFSIAGHEGYLTYSTFEDGSLGEIFIRMAKQGSTLAGLLDAFAIAISIALQYGVPLKELASKFINMRFEPMGLTNNEKIKTATSIVDYIFKYLAYRFLSKEDLEELGLMTEEEKDKLILKEHPTLFEKKNNPGLNHLKDISGPPCIHCGGITIKTGSCYTCTSCGETTSCG
jgi:ribonucleoside-diphosphate reductase alpha chain